MKQLSVALLSVLACTGICSSCIGRDVIWDINPVNTYMEIVDRSGANLFDKATPGNWLEESISATFEGETWSYPAEEETRAFMPEMYGLRVVEYGSSTEPPRPVLVFGELSGETERNSDLVITWPDGTEDTLTISREFRWKANGAPKGKTVWKLNGKETGIPIRIVK